MTSEAGTYRWMAPEVLNSLVYYYYYYLNICIAKKGFLLYLNFPFSDPVIQHRPTSNWSKETI